jgi:hypothetical protein
LEENGKTLSPVGRNGKTLSPVGRKRQDAFSSWEKTARRFLQLRENTARRFLQLGETKKLLVTTTTKRLRLS